MCKEKQIEEMAKVIDDVDVVEFTVLGLNDALLTVKVVCERVAEKLYTAGYRKQSEGEWEKRTFIIFDSEKVGFRCSGCNTTWDTPTNFCPNCGAHMKGGAE